MSALQLAEEVFLAPGRVKTGAVPAGAELVDVEWRRARVEADLAALPGLRAALVELNLYCDVDAEIGRCVPPMYVSPQPPRDIRRRYGIYFDVREVARFVEFCRRLRHVKGRWAGHSFIPDLWEIVYVLGPLTTTAPSTRSSPSASSPG
ncbi:MAG: hypothetical protein ACRDYV_15965 [Acidimicrobiia bacterium]